MIKILIYISKFTIYKDYLCSLLLNFDNLNIIFIDNLINYTKENENLHIIQFIKYNINIDHRTKFIFFDYFNEELFILLRSYFLINIYTLCLSYDKINKHIENNLEHSPYFFKINYFTIENNILLEYQKNNSNYTGVKKNNNNIALINQNCTNKNLNELTINLNNHKIDLTIINENLYNLEDIFSYKIICFLEKDIKDISIYKYIFNKIIVFIPDNIIMHNYEQFIIKYNNDNIITKIKEIISNYNSFHTNLFRDFNIDKINNKIKENNKIFLKKTNLFNIDKIDIIDKIDTIDKIDKINSKNIDDFGFIILRHVNNKNTNLLWKTNIKNIRKYYNNKIYIIDDDSCKEFINENEINNYKNCFLIKSEYNKRGEILPYHYLYKKKLFKKALILHDGTFINQYINFDDIKEDIKYIWHFTHDWDNEEEELKLLDIINNQTLINFYKTQKWYGCFGIQSIISYNFLEKIYDKYNFDKIINYIDSRPKRMNFERIFSVICTYENNNLYKMPSLYGIIHHYIHWGYNFENYIDDLKNNNISQYPLIKIWNGR